MAFGLAPQVHGSGAAVALRAHARALRGSRCFVFCASVLAVFLGLQIAESRSCLHTLGPKLSMVYILGAVGGYGFQDRKGQGTKQMSIMLNFYVRSHYYGSGEFVLIWDLDPSSTGTLKPVLQTPATALSQCLVGVLGLRAGCC